MKHYTDIVTAELLGDKEYLEMLKGLDTVVSNKIVLAALKKGGEIILGQAKSNFMTTKKNASKTGYAGFDALFQVKQIKSRYKTGVMAVISGYSGYKYRWAQWGTTDREYTKKGSSKPHYTGRIQATNFFYSAKESKAEAVNTMIRESIIEALQKMKKDAENKSAT